MTREGPEERSDEGPSEKASGESEGRDERSEERPSETRPGSETTREQSDPRDREGPEERSDEGFSEKTNGEKPRTNGDGEGGEIPLQIAGHEDRDPPGELEGDAPFGESGDDDDQSDTGETEYTTPDDEDPGSDGEDEEVEPVEVLVQLADGGQIDPWDIDVVRVTDKFLHVLDAQDLRTSGRALFYASVLIRMKSDAMLADDDEQEEPAEPWEEAMVEDAPIDEPDPFASLEDEMDRRLERRRARGMPQTLDELVRDLRDAERESWWKESRSYDTSDSPHGFQRGAQELDYRSADDLRMDDEPTEDDVTGTTHAENMDDVIEAVYEALAEQYDAGREEVLYREIHMAGGSRVETFLGLLFLSHRGRVRLQQDDLFGDLWIQDPAAMTRSEEAVAD